MSMHKVAFWLGIGVTLAGVSTTALAQAPVAKPATLWSFLGIPQAYHHVHDSVANRFGNHPACEGKPPLKGLADPANLKSDNPAIKKAAEIKQQEDMKQQKIKAVKYLAQIGCGCYNRDGSITDALLKAMDDCTEDVRYQTVLAITAAANGETCANCKQRSCCSEELSNKLYEIAYERNEEGCFLEPSERVRLLAAEALRACCPGTEEEPTPAEIRGGEIRGGERPEAPNPSGGEQPATPRPGASSGFPPLPPTPVPAESRASADKGIEPKVDPSFTEPKLIRLPPPPAQSATASAAAQPSTNQPRSSRRTASQHTAVPKPVEQTAPAASAPTDKSADDRLPTSPFSLAAQTPTAPEKTVSKEKSAAVPETVSPVISSQESSRPPAYPIADAQDLAPVVAGPTMRQTAGKTVSSTSPKSSRRAAEQPAAAVIPVAAPIVRSSEESRTTILPQPSVIKRLPTDSSPEAENQPTQTDAPRVGQFDLQAAAPIVPAWKRPLPGAEFGTAVVTSVNERQSRVVVEVGKGAIVPVGSVLRAYHQYAFTSRKAVCDLEVVQADRGIAVARPREGSRLEKLSVGDEAIVLR